MKNKLLNKIENKDMVMGVIGLGYVGLPLAVEKAKVGFKTIGFDVQKEKVELVNTGKNYIGDVVGDDLKKVIEKGNLVATTDFSRLSEVDFIAICVPTPLDNFKQPDITYVEESAKNISKYLKRETVIVLESTTYPGTTEELVLPILEESGLICGEDFYLGYSPERVDPGNPVYKTKNTPKVIGGVGVDATDVIAEVYKQVLSSEVHKVSTPKVAEMEKILENTYRNINIGLVNEMAIICNKMNINIWEVIDAAKSKPYGFQAFYPGPGLGGHCIPLDPFYLSWKAREFNYHMKMVEISGEINDYMPEYVVERSAKILNKIKKPLNGSKVLICGVAYKQDIDDYRESPSLQVIENFETQGAEISYYDPYIPTFKHHGVERKSIADLSKLNTYDLIVITTAHTTVNYLEIADSEVEIFDTKNAMKEINNRKNIELL